MTDERFCIDCEQAKPLSEFYMHRQNGRVSQHSYCKACHKARAVASYERRRAGFVVRAQRRPNRPMPIEAPTPPATIGEAFNAWATDMRGELIASLGLRVLKREELRMAA